MEAGEAIAIGGLEEELAAKCPFKDEPLGVGEVEAEDVSKDDLEAEESDGGALGRNLKEGRHGGSGTWDGDPPRFQSERRDTRRQNIRAGVPGTSTIPDGVFGFTVAAHHLIPGVASLENSDLKSFMTQGDSVEVNTTNGPKQKTIRKHIGYNVNGSHNGVWLPGNYYIRAATSPIKGTTWSALEENPWCLHYVAAVTKAGEGQFHDAHTKYSDAVKDLLNKISAILSEHECETCEPTDINPPLRIKVRLYGLSGYLRTQLKAPPRDWKRPWFASDRWRESAFVGGHPSSGFLEAYERAQTVSPAAP